MCENTMRKFPADTVFIEYVENSSKTFSAWEMESESHNSFSALSFYSVTVQVNKENTEKSLCVQGKIQITKSGT